MPDNDTHAAALVALHAAADELLKMHREGEISAERVLERIAARVADCDAALEKGAR